MYEIIDYSGDDILVHHGVKGQKWGVRTKQYVPKGRTSRSSNDSNKTSDSNSGSKIQQRVKQRLATRHTNKVAKKKARLKEREQLAKAKAKTMAAEKEVKKLNSEKDIAAKKEEILKSRSGKALYKNADLFTTEELASAYRRLKLEKDLNSIDPKVKSKTEVYLDKAKSLGDAMSTVNSTLESGMKLYKTLDSMFGDSTSQKQKPKQNENEKKDGK